MAEQCNRHRRKGGQCLSQASLPAAGGGEPRRAPEGPCYGQHGFGYFCRNKSSSSSGDQTPVSKNLPIILTLLIRYSTPAGWLPGGMLFASSGPCVSPSALAQDKLRELGRSAKSSRPSSSVRPAGASMGLATFAETKVPGRPGTKPRLNPVPLSVEGFLCFFFVRYAQVG